MKTPKHWNKRGIRFEVMLSLTPLYYLFFILKKRLTKPAVFSVPIICVGNVIAGGAGKTPTALALAALLKKHYPKLAFVSRGYGGTITTAHKINPEVDTAETVGDEPLLLATTAPCYIAKERKYAVELAIKEGATLIIMDDGLQHFAVAREANIIVIDGGFGFGNYGLMPAGPLREKISAAVKRSHAILVIGESTKKELYEDKRLAEIPHFKAVMKSTLPLPSKQKSYFAFAGIARPQKFYDSLRSAGYDIKGTVDFNDHHQYTRADIHLLDERAKALGAHLITTTKDAIRLPQDLREKTEVLQAALDIENINAFEQLLLTRIKKKIAHT